MNLRRFITGLAALAALTLVLPSTARAEMMMAGWSVDWMTTDTPAQTGLSYPYDEYLSQTADQGRIVYVTKGEADAERVVYLYDGDTGESRPLSDVALGASQPQLLGDLVAWVGFDGPDGEVFLHTISTGQTVKITDNLNSDWAPLLSEDYLLWNQGQQGQVSLWSYELATGATRRLTDPGNTPRVTVGGSWAVEQRYTRGVRSVIVYDLQTGEHSQPDRLQEIEILDVVGEAVLARSRGADGLGLYDLPSGQWQTISTGQVGWAGADPAGGRVVYAEWTSSGAQIRVLDVQSGSLRSVPVPGMAVGEVSLSGNVLIYRAAIRYGSQYGPGRSYVLLLSQGSATQLLAGYGGGSQLFSDGERAYWFAPVLGDEPLPEPPYYEPPYSTLLQLFVAQPPASSPPAFTDVAPTAPERTAIVSLAERGIVAGYPVSNGAAYRPDAQLHRAQFAKIIALAAGLPVDESLTSAFRDLGPDDEGLYPHQYVAAATEAGIIRGFSATSFGPYRALSRAQLVTMVVRAAEALEVELRYPPDDYLRYPSQGINKDPARGRNWLTAGMNGLLDGVVEYPAVWDPYASATRADAAQVVWNLMRLHKLPRTGPVYWY